MACLSYELEEAESDFDRRRNGRWSSVRAERRLEPPASHRLYGLFIEAEAEALGNANIDGAAVSVIVAIK